MASARHRKAAPARRWKVRAVRANHRYLAVALVVGLVAVGASSPHAVTQADATVATGSSVEAAAETTADVPDGTPGRSDAAWSDRLETEVSRSQEREAIKLRDRITPKFGAATPKKVEAEEEDEAATEESGDEAPDASGGVSGAACADGSSVESGVGANVVKVHRAVCASFPEVSSYGGLRGGGGEHAEGRALDIMVSSSSLGQSIADFVRANAGSLGVSEVIWSQHIWTVQRSSEGWRAMEDRGSTTANHYDHVHVTTY